MNLEPDQFYPVHLSTLDIAGKGIILYHVGQLKASCKGQASEMTDIVSLYEGSLLLGIISRISEYAWIDAT